MWNDRFILSGDFIGSRMNWPTTIVGGVDQGNGDLSQGLLGLGVTYYFMPINIFLSGTIGAGNVIFVTNDTDYKSKEGVGLQLKAGKEWWVSGDWGLGVSMFLLSQNVTESNDQTLKGGLLGVMFNTTFKGTSKNSVLGAFLLEKRQLC